jgi:hypothetical protein
LTVEEIGNVVVKNPLLDLSRTSNDHTETGNGPDMTYFDLNQDETRQLVDSIKNIQPAFNGCVETRRYIRPRQDCRSTHASDCTSCIFSLFQETELEELEGPKADGSIPLNITNASNYFGKSQKRKHSLQEPIKLSPTFSISSVIASNSVIF